MEDGPMPGILANLPLIQLEEFALRELLVTDSSALMKIKTNRKENDL